MKTIGITALALVLSNASSASAAGLGASAAVTSPVTPSGTSSGAPSGTSSGAAQATSPAPAGATAAKADASTSASSAAAATGVTGEAGATGAGAAADPDAVWEARERQLQEASTLTGGVGLLHMQHAQGGAPGQFRLGLTGSYMTGQFLCTDAFPCVDPRDPTRQLTSDDNTQSGAHLTLSVQVLKWLEGYLSTSATSNSNAANRPSLLQVVGDSNLGVKVHGKLARVLHVGGAGELWLINGTSGVGLDGGGTSAKFRGLATVDLREAAKPIPLRFSVNGTYVLDNTADTVASVEASRGAPIHRIERYALGINRTDRFEVNVGAELFAAQQRVRPFVEYGLAIPINRQGYACRSTNPSGDKCMASAGFAPSTLTIGARILPWKSGFHLTAALDLGITGVATFLEEVKPTAPWMAYLGAGWAFDTVERPAAVRVVETRVPVSVGRQIHGIVHEAGKTEGVADAIVSWENHPEETSLATDKDGRFVTRRVADGTYVFGIRAEGFEPARCTAMVAGQPASTFGASSSATMTESSEPDVTIDCVVRALPRVANLVGHVTDAETHNPVARASVKVIDADRKEHAVVAGTDGTFRIDAVAQGEAQLTASAPEYLAATETVKLEPRRDSTVTISLAARPKKASVTVGANEIVIKQQILFAVDSATILPASNGLLSEIADALINHPKIRRVEVQGHTDATGSPEHNMELSTARANAVVSWLRAHGVASDRLEAKGYGQTKPLAPNVTNANRAKNRRVQFIIVDQGPTDAPTPVVR